MRGKIISCCAGRPAEGRIGLHDLLRAFAAARSWEEDAQTTRDAAVRRLGEDLLEAAKLHEWVAYLRYTEIAIDEVEKGELDSWFLPPDEAPKQD